MLFSTELCTSVTWTTNAPLMGYDIAIFLHVFISIALKDLIADILGKTGNPTDVVQEHFFYFT